MSTDVSLNPIIWGRLCLDLPLGRSPRTEYSLRIKWNEKFCGCLRVLLIFPLSLPSSPVLPTQLVIQLLNSIEVNCKKMPGYPHQTSMLCWSLVSFKVNSDKNGASSLLKDLIETYSLILTSVHWLGFQPIAEGRSTLLHPLSSWQHDHVLILYVFLAPAHRKWA